MKNGPVKSHVKDNQLQVFTNRTVDYKVIKMNPKYRQIFIDLILFLTVLVPLLLSLAGVLRYDRGKFHCSDPTIQLNYRPDTISTKILLILTFVPIIFIVFPTELMNSGKAGIKQSLIGGTKQTVSAYASFFVASTLNIAVNNILKCLTAVPRPHFIQTCQPDWSSINCTDNAGHVDFRRELCLSTDTKMIYDSMQSFPSGHAQMTAFTATYIALYIERSISEDNSKVWKRLLQLLLFILPVYCGTSRIQDQRHHVVDVWVGALIGCILAVISVVFIFKEDKVTSKTTKTNRREPVDTEDRKEKQKRPSKIRLLSDFGFGSMVETDREMREVNPAC